jgi:hypothetical protein
LPGGNDGNVNPLSKGQDEHIDSGGVISLIALVPIVFIFGLLFLLFHMKSKSAGAILLEEDYVLIVGTGDHPRSYHDGHYHFTQTGTRYLSTNCDFCNDTRMYGFVNYTDLGLSRDYNSRISHVVGESDSVSTKDSGLTDVDSVLGPYCGGPLSLLGRKHGDVHICNSATCELCEQRRQDGLQFSPTGTSPPRPDPIVHKLTTHPSNIEEPSLGYRGDDESTVSL